MALSPHHYSFIYFESKEGKGESDARGSVEKMRIERMVLRDRKLVIHNAKELVEALGHVPPEVTESYEFTVVEEFSEFVRVPAKQRTGVELRGIHNFTRSTSVRLDLKPVQCLAFPVLGCRRSVESVHRNAPPSPRQSWLEF